MSDKTEKTYNYKNPRNRAFMNFIQSEANSAGGIGKLSELTGISRPTITFWYNGERVADAEQLVKLSKKLHVSIDYMLTGVASQNIEIAEATGLSNEAIEALRYMQHDHNHYDVDHAGNVNKRTIAFINRVLELYHDRLNYDEDGDTKFLPTIFKDMEDYVTLRKVTGTVSELDPISNGYKRASGVLVSFDDPDMVDVWDMSELRSMALLKRIERSLDALHEREVSNGEH